MRMTIDLLYLTLSVFNTSTYTLFHLSLSIDVIIIIVKLQKIMCITQEKYMNYYNDTNITSDSHHMYFYTIEIVDKQAYIARAARQNPRMCKKCETLFRRK